MTNKSCSDDPFFENIQRLQDQYYAKEPKNTFFKKQQKEKCAQQIATQININELIVKTAIIIPNTNRLWIDYTVFKTYANPHNYPHIVFTIIEMILSVIKRFDSFELHINLHTFSISAAERYKDGVYMFFDECIKRQTSFDDTMVKMYIYNTPSMMDSITTFFSPVVSKEVKRKIVFCSKKNSNEQITQLFL